MLNQTLEHLRRAAPVPARRTTVLFCPALTRARFEQERRPPSALARLFGARPRDFAGEDDLIFGWDDYVARVVQPAWPYLEMLDKETPVRVIPDATFPVFKKALHGGHFDLLFVVSHRPSAEVLQFEFADGAHDLREVAGELKRLDAERRVSLVFFTCRSKAARSDLYGRIPGLESVGYADWHIPLAEGLDFLCRVVAELDGQTTVPDAWDRATRNFVNTITDD